MQDPGSEIKSLKTVTAEHDLKSRALLSTRTCDRTDHTHRKLALITEQIRDKARREIKRTRASVSRHGCRRGTKSRAEKMKGGPLGGNSWGLPKTQTWRTAMLSKTAPPSWAQEPRAGVRGELRARRAQRAAALPTLAQVSPWGPGSWSKPGGTFCVEESKVGKGEGLPPDWWRSGAGGSAGRRQEQNTQDFRLFRAILHRHHTDVGISRLCFRWNTACRWASRPPVLRDEMWEDRPSVTRTSWASSGPREQPPSPSRALLCTGRESVRTRTGDTHLRDPQDLLSLGDFLSLFCRGENALPNPKMRPVFSIYIVLPCHCGPMTWVNRCEKDETLLCQAVQTLGTYHRECKTWQPIFFLIFS